MTSEVDTPHGPARVHLRPSRAGRAALVLGHGAGGSVDAADLAVVAQTAQSLDVAVALVEQPYRVAGRRTPAPAGQLDTAWTAVVDRLRAHELAGLPIIAGGRSSGARVACRTAVATGAVAVLCLAFPLRPPPRRTASSPPISRLPELEQVPVPTLVVQGDRDPFGLPPAGENRTVVQVAGNHGSRMDLEAVAVAVRCWLSSGGSPSGAEDAAPRQVFHRFPPVWDDGAGHARPGRRPCRLDSTLTSASTETPGRPWSSTGRSSAAPPR